MGRLLNNNPEIIIAKANVNKLMGERLLNAGFKVLNDGRNVNFPSNSHQNEFCEMVKLILCESDPTKA